MKGLGSMPWKELGKRQFSTTWIEIIKQNVAFLFYGSNSGSLFTQSYELEVDSLQFSCQSLWLGVFQVSQSSTKCRGMKRIQIKTCDSVFLLYRFMACGQLAEALLVCPSRPSGNSTLGRSHTWKQCVDHIGRGSSGFARKI